jgi:hypothetical protein
MCKWQYIPGWEWRFVAMDGAIVHVISINIAIVI